MNDRLVSVKEVAEYLGVHRNYVHELVAKGELPSFKIGGNRRFRESDVTQFVAAHAAG